MSSMEPREMVQEMGQVLDTNRCGWELSKESLRDVLQWRLEVCNLSGLCS